MKKLLVFIVALMASLTLSAQEMRYGVTGGVNFAWMHNPIVHLMPISDLMPVLRLRWI